MDINPFDSLRIACYNGIRKTPNTFFFAANMWLTYGLLYKKINSLKTYFDDHRLKWTLKKRKLMFRLACQENIFNSYNH